MANRIEISLAADGSIALHLPLHTCRVQMTVEGVALLRHVLQANERRLGDDGNPTQWQLDQWLKSAEGRGALQLAGDRKRFADIKAKTEVGVRKIKPRGVPFNLDTINLEDLI